MQWEYKTVKLGTKGFWMGGDLDATEFTMMLNELGRDRWELVSAFETYQGHGSTRNVVAVFQRPMQK